MVAEALAAELGAGYDIRPTIAVTQAHVIMARSAVRTMGSAVGREIIRGVLGSIMGSKKR